MRFHHSYIEICQRDGYDQPKSTTLTEVIIYATQIQSWAIQYKQKYEECVNILLFNGAREFEVQIVFRFFTSDQSLLLLMITTNSKSQVTQK